MISKTLNRYIWLLNILIQKGKLTFEEINELWQESNLGDGTWRGNQVQPVRRLSLLYCQPTGHAERQDATVVAELLYAVEYDYSWP